MDKAKALEIFLELLEAWEESECFVIHDRGDIEEYKLLELRKEKYHREFLNAINV